MRDEIKEIKYFVEFEERMSSQIAQYYSALESKKIIQERAYIIERVISTNLMKVAISMYSRGCDISKLGSTVTKALAYMYESWSKSLPILKNSKLQNCGQLIFDEHDKIIVLFSLSCLLNICRDIRHSILSLLLENDININLINYLSQSPDATINLNESYYYFEDTKRIYETLNNVICSSEYRFESNYYRESLLYKYIKYEWYARRSENELYHELHMTNNYFGYWSFESAAVTCIMNLDDSTYRQLQYYPKDLVDYYRAVRLK